MACCEGKQDRWIPSWCGFIDYVPTVPQLYWNVNSNEQRYHVLCKELHKLICYADMLGDSLEITHEQVDQLERDFIKFKESGFLDYYQKQLEAWINLHMPTLIAQAMKMVWFGLNDMKDPEFPGYFVAWIPDSWKDILFDTSLRDGDYGCLILNYNDDMSYYSPGSAYDVLDQILDAMNSRIDAETTAREDADTEINGNITTINNTILIYSDDIEGIQDDISDIGDALESIDLNLDTINNTLYTDLGVDE